MERDESGTEAIGRRFRLLAPVLDERRRRLVVAAEAVALGRGGITQVARATGVCRRVIAAGVAELGTADVLPIGRARQPGGGRKRTVDTDPTLRADLERLVDPVTRGDPESPLRWTAKSLHAARQVRRRDRHGGRDQVAARVRIAQNRQHRGAVEVLARDHESRPRAGGVREGFDNVSAVKSY